MRGPLTATFPTGKGGAERHPLALVLVLATLVAGMVWASGCGDGATEPSAPTPDPPRPTTVTVTPATPQFAALGATVRLAAEVHDQNGQVMAVATVTWASGAAAVATVDGSGLVTAVGNGTATITATAGGASGSATVTVAQEISAVVVTPAADTLVAGDTLRLAAEATDANGHPVAEPRFSWVSSDTSVAVVDDAGLVTGLDAGQVEVTATAAGVTGRADLTVVAPAPMTIAVTPDTVALTALGQTAQLSAEVRDQIGRVMEDVRVAWSSADTSVAAVDSAGLVTAVGNGAATINAASGGAAGAAVVTVSAVIPECVADMIVPPGGSCRYPESDQLFSVSLTGEMSFLFYGSQVGINLDLSHSDGIRYKLLARNSGDGSWVIVGVAESYSARSVPTEECWVGLVVLAAQGCRYPGTDILFLPSGTGNGAELDHWAPELSGTLFIVHAPHSGFFSFSYSDVQFSAHRSTDESWTIDRVGDSPLSPFECEVGMHVGPGGSCVYPGTTKRLSVDQAGRGSFDGRTDARAIRANAPGLALAAATSDGVFWTITTGPVRRAAVPTAHTECRVSMVLDNGDACRYPGTDHVFWVSGGNGGFDQIQYEYSMGIDADGVVFRAHTLGAQSWIVAKVGAESNTPPPPPTRALVDRPDDVTGPQIHVVYAVASDGEDLQLDRSPSSPQYRRLTYRNQGRVSIHLSFRTIQEWLAEQIGQQLRLDTYRGEIDVSFVRLPFTETEIAADPDAMFDRVQSVVREETRTSKALAIVYHGLAEETVIGGLGEIEGDAAWLLMRGFIEVTQFGGDHGWEAPYSVDLVMVHEIFHMMGAAPVCASRSAGKTEVDYCPAAGHHVSDARDIMGSNNTPTAQIDPDRNDYYGHGYPDCTDIAKSQYFKPAQ